jgi:hypothetical protein
MFVMEIGRWIYRLPSGLFSLGKPFSLTGKISFIERINSAKTKVETMSVPFKILYFSLVFLGGCQGIKCTQVSSFICFGIFLPGIQAVLT